MLLGRFLMERTTNSGPVRDVLALFVSVAVCFAVSGLGGLITAQSVGTWYQDLAKPAFNPPDWIFAPVWTTLFLLMAVAAWRVWRSVGLRDGRTALFTFGVQLALNLGWSATFFGLRMPGAALIVVLLLLAAIVITQRLFWSADRSAGLLLVPLLAWVGFATVLNAAIWRLN